MKVDLQNKEKYVSPLVKVIKVEVEKGFAVSDSGSYINEPKQRYFYTLDKVNDGGAAW